MRAHPANTPGSRRAAGISFVEVIAAVALLGLVVASMTGAFSSLFAAQIRQDHRLACAELAHRLIVSYLDDPESMPSEHESLAYGNAKYRWDMHLSRIDAEPGGELRIERRTDDLGLDRFRDIVVRVWLSDESGGSREFARGVPRAEIERVFDLFPMRNPDSLEPLVDTNEGMRRLIEIITGGGGGP